jgi:hypothetical protein
VIGKKAKIGIHLRLKMGENYMSLLMLKNTKVKVTVTNHQNIKTFYSFDFAEWNKNEQLIEFPLQSYTSNISIVVESQVKLYTNKYANLVVNKEIPIDLGERQSSFLDFYLEKKDKEYLLNLLGANGEPILHTDINITYSILGTDEIVSQQLRTNNDGQVNLGELAIAKKLIA